MSVAADSIDVSLLSHTNVGKTTLARTLLRQDIGEVADRPHVTELAEASVLVESPEGDRLVLWDTPGFGDSARLLRRLQASGNPLGWFLRQVWDRLTDRPFWCSQQAMRNAREQSDVVLYVVNASEDPASATYVDAELSILQWIGKPIVVLLNQLGAARGAAADRADAQRWRAHLTRFPDVRGVLPFDAFARCWVLESTLLTEVEAALPQEKRAALERLRVTWRARDLKVFSDAMRVLAGQLAAVAADSERLAERGTADRARAYLTSIATGTAASDPGLDRGQRALAERLDRAVRDSTDELVRLHGLTGRATQEILQRMGSEFAIERPADADKAGVIGGLVSGALGGLAADLAAGGLTFGAGAIIGGVLGAFGARGLARAYNLATGSEAGIIRWSSEFLDERTAAALARYLAVAHFGRGRGAFVAGETPAHWKEAIAHAMDARRARLDAVWRAMLDRAATEQALLPLLTAMASEALARLYPEAAAAAGLTMHEHEEEAAR
jgi:hypothetical protein